MDCRKISIASSIRERNHMCLSYMMGISAFGKLLIKLTSYIWTRKGRLTTIKLLKGYLSLLDIRMSKRMKLLRDYVLMFMNLFVTCFVLYNRWSKNFKKEFPNLKHFLILNSQPHLPLSKALNRTLQTGLKKGLIKYWFKSV